MYRADASQIHRLRTIQRLGAAVAAAAEADEIFDAAMEGLIDAVAADRASVLLFDEDDVLRFRGWRGLSDNYRRAVEGHTPWTPTDADAVPITVPDVAADPDLGDLRTTILGEGIRALAFIPLISGGHLLGKFMIYHDRPHEFTEGELLLCQIMAGHVAYAIERQRAEESLRRRAEETQTLLDTLPIGVFFAHDRDSRRITGNRAAHELVRVPADSNLSASAPDGERPAYTVVSRSGVEVPVDELPVQRAARGEHVRDEEITVVLEDGSARHLLMSAAPLRDGKGESRGAIASALDITQRTRAQRELRESEARYRAVVESQAEMLCRFRLDGTILFVNGAYARARGATPEALIGGNFWNFVAEEDRAAVRATLDRLTPDAPEVRIENRFETADGPRWTLWTNRGLVFDENGRLVEAQSAGIDITERRRAEEALHELNEELEQRVAERTAELEQQNRRLRELAGQLTEVEQQERHRLAKSLHDGLQHILLAAKMQLPLYQRENRSAEDMERLADLLDQAIAASRSLSYELSPPVLYHSDLPKAIQWLADWFHKHHELDVELRVARGFPTLPDPVKIFLFGAVRELLLNSVKHSGGRIARIDFDRRDARASITVADEGHGFDPMKLEWQGGELHGLGLFSIRERLIALGGTFQIVASRGAGASFLLTVPVAEEEQGRDSAESVRSTEIPAFDPARHAYGHGQGPVRVMIVDDHVMVREGLSSLLLKAEGVELVAEARDGEEAVKLAGELRPNVVVMDLEMPRMNGIEATRRIKRAHPEILVIGLSFHEERDKIENMRRAGASAYLQKGGNAEALFKTIRDLCGKRIA